MNIVTIILFLIYVKSKEQWNSYGFHHQAQLIQLLLIADFGILACWIYKEDIFIHLEVQQ